MAGATCRNTLVDSIASQLGIHRSTVAKFVRAATFPERGQRDYPTRADEFKDYLWDRWKSGCHNARRLTDEIKQRGFTGHYSSVRRLVARWRRQDGTSAQPPRKRFDSPTGSQLSWLLVRKQGDLTEDERVVKQALLDHCQEIQRTWNLAADFVQMLRERRSESLDSWLDRATGGDTAPSLRRFAEGLKKDLAAVTAALSLRWNNGPAEGHISRLKMLKRQMYGRAHFDLLRARFLYAA